MTETTEERSSESLREEVRSFLSGHPAEQRQGVAWMEAVFDAGWATPSWPVQWGGRGLLVEATHVVRDEFARVGAPGAGQDLSNIPANTILTWGSDELKREFLRPFATGALRSCLLYSEPGAGSDLAGVRTRAERNGEEWVVNGQKVWTTGARDADFGLLVARTNWDVPKHQGIAFFLCPMHQDGVEVRPIVQITGDSTFNEVFLTDARVPAANLVGEEGYGWRVLATALAVERVLLGGMNPQAAGRETAGPAALVRLAKEKGLEAEPLVRQALAELSAWQLLNRWNSMRFRASGQGGSALAASSIAKLTHVRIAKRAAALQLALLGSDSMLDEEGPTGKAALQYLGSLSASLVGGTDQIQRNIVGERILGLPREPEVDRDIPFREVRTSVGS